jgi:hypothetical protein
VEKELLGIISLHTPKPSDPIRRALARCYVSLFSKGDAKTLGETVTLLQSIVLSTKGPEGLEAKLYVRSLLLMPV